MYICTYIDRTEIMHFEDCTGVGKLCRKIFSLISNNLKNQIIAIFKREMATTYKEDINIYSIFFMCICPYACLKHIEIKITIIEKLRNHSHEVVAKYSSVFCI